MLLRADRELWLALSTLRSEPYTCRLLIILAAVVFEEYEAMPHTFALMLPSTPNAKHCYDSWAGFIRQAVEDPKSIKSSAKMLKAKTLEVEERDLENLCEVGVEEMRERIQAYASGDVEAKL